MECRARSVGNASPIAPSSRPLPSRARWDAPARNRAGPGKNLVVPSRWEEPVAPARAGWLGLRKRALLPGAAARRAVSARVELPVQQALRVRPGPRDRAVGEVPPAPRVWTADPAQRVAVVRAERPDREEQPERATAATA